MSGGGSRKALCQLIDLHPPESRVAYSTCMVEIIVQRESAKMTAPSLTCGDLVVATTDMSTGRPILWMA